MKIVIFDIETKNTFSEVGSNSPEDLDISVVGIYDYENNLYSTFEQEEFNELWNILEETDVLVGFNSIYFDLPLLNKYYPNDLRKKEHIDIFLTVREATGRKISLDNIAQATLDIGKSGDGLQAVRLWSEDKKQEVKDYCKKDVEITKRIFEYGKEKGILKYNDIGVTKEIRIDNSDWKKEPIKENKTLKMEF